MKLLLSILLLSFSLASRGQAIFDEDVDDVQFGAGLTLATTSRSTAAMEMYFQLKRKHFVFTPLSVFVQNKNNPSVPTIFETRAGWILGPIEPYVGLAFHAAGQDGKQEFKKYAGLRPAAGIIYHFYKSAIIKASVSGNVYSFGIGIFKLKTH